MQGSASVVHKLAWRELTGSLKKKYSNTKKTRLYEKCPEHLQISIRDIISQRNLLLGHVVTGFSRNGKYVISYQCRIIDEIEDGCPYLGYQYSLHWWRFHYKQPSRKVHVVPLFVDEDVYNELHLLICQPPSGKHIIVHGCSSNLRSPVMHTTPSRSVQSSTCYLTVAPAPVELKDGIKCTEDMLGCQQGISYALHLKYELVPPHPPFFPSVNLKFNDVILINSGDFICAISAYINLSVSVDDEKRNLDKPNGIFETLNCASDCFCGFLSRYRDISCPGKRDYDVFLSDSMSSTSHFCNTNFSVCKNLSCEMDEKLIFENSESLRDDFGAVNRNSSEGATTASAFSNHTSCYLSFYGDAELRENASFNSPFDCTSTAFPITVTNEFGRVLPQIGSHRCFAEDSTRVDVQAVSRSADVIVKQVIFDAEQFLDEKLRSLESIKDKFVSLKDYDMQLVQVCTWSKEIIILIKALIHLNGKIDETKLSTGLSTYSTGFLLTWNIQTGVVSSLLEQPFVEFEKQKCKSRSVCHGLEQAVELRRKAFYPTNFRDSVMSFSNHTVFSGKSMKYILHPFQPIALVM